MILKQVCSKNGSYNIDDDSTSNVYNDVHHVGRENGIGWWWAIARKENNLIQFDATNDLIWHSQLEIFVNWTMIELISVGEPVIPFLRYNSVHDGQMSAVRKADWCIITAPWT